MLQFPGENEVESENKVLCPPPLVLDHLLLLLRMGNETWQDEHGTITKDYMAARVLLSCPSLLHSWPPLTITYGHLISLHSHLLGQEGAAALLLVGHENLLRRTRDVDRRLSDSQDWICPNG